MGLMASLGLTTVPVRRRPRVAILSTGDELVAPGTPLGPGQIYSSNNYSLVGLVMAAGATPVDLGVAPDNLEQTVSALKKALEFDVVVTTGGVSVGVYDYVKEAYGALGAPLDFWKVKMKPGKPLAFGRAEHDGRSIPLFGLPGNPVSCMINFLQFVRPWLRMSLGFDAPWLPVVDARMAHGLRSKPGRARLERVVLQRDGETLWARSTGSQSSGVLTSMAKASGLLLLDPEIREVAEGAPVRVQVVDPDFLDGEGPDYGW